MKNHDIQYVLIVIDEEDREKLFGPFYTAEEALKWGEDNYSYEYTPYTIMAKALYYPMKQEQQ